ncbi:MmgE/PrpD family protein [Pigmentiphaga soli]|uniref:MmgE/PrpD family protein n=2 Tax=Pigmentiphaga soli TaxID=1007095 RepID=A0ABP8GZT4_9BURK
MLTRRLAEFVIETSKQDIPGAVLDAARNAFIDTVGCALAGVSEPVSELAARWVDETGARPQATVWGRRLSSSPAEAAFANGIASHALDFDDAMPTLRGHPSTTLVPAALAAGEVVAAAGESVLAAYVLGLEVAGKLGSAVGDGHYFRGWHTTATIGMLASTAAAARLWKLTPAELCTAWGLAASQVSGLVRNFGSMAKPFHAGHAARAGILSAWMAKRGFTAEPAVFDVPGGFMSTYGGGDGPPLEECVARLGQPWEIFEPGVFVKRWPCCYANHRPVGGILRLVAEHGIRVEEIEAVEVGFLPGGDGALVSTDPQTGLEAKFSIEYSAAAVLLDGDLTLATFTDPMVRRPQARALMARVRRHRLEAEGTYSGLKGYTDVAIVTAGRGRFALRVDKTPGSPAWPLTDAERERKFIGCAALALDDASLRRLLDRLVDMRALPDVHAVTQATVRRE